MKFKKSWSIIFSCLFFLPSSQLQAVTGGDIAGTMIRGLNSGVSLLVFAQYMDQLQPALQSTEANLRAAVADLKQDAKYFVQAQKQNNERVKLLASKKFLGDVARMQTIGHFLEYIVDAFDHLAKGVELIPGGASGKIRGLANQIESYKNEMAIVWKMAGLMAQSMNDSCATNTNNSPSSVVSDRKPVGSFTTTSSSSQKSEQGESQLEELVF